MGLENKKTVILEQLVVIVLDISPRTSSGAKNLKTTEPEPQNAQ